MVKKKIKVIKAKKKKRLRFRLLLPLATGVFAVFFALFFVVNAHLGTSFCANGISCINNLSGKVEPTATKGVYMGKAVSIPDPLLAVKVAVSPVLGASSNPNKHIYVDLTNQHLYAFAGNDMVLNFPISSGKWHYTPTGTFKIWIKLQATRMTGGNPAIGTYYDLPNVPWTMFFYNNQVAKSEGYSLHGAYWHNNFGHPMSHGCVNISPDNAKLLYDWADPPTLAFATYATNENPGTLVTIFGTTPNE